MRNRSWSYRDVQPKARSDNIVPLIAKCVFCISLVGYWALAGLGAVVSYLSFHAEIKAARPIVESPGSYGMAFVFLLLAWPSVMIIIRTYKYLFKGERWIPPRSIRQTRGFPFALIAMIYIGPLFVGGNYFLGGRFEHNAEREAANRGYAPCFQGKGDQTRIYFVRSKIIEVQGCPAGMSRTYQLYRH